MNLISPICKPRKYVKQPFASKLELCVLLFYFVFWLFIFLYVRVWNGNKRIIIINIYIVFLVQL